MSKRILVFSELDLASMNVLKHFGFTHKQEVFQNCIVWILSTSSVHAEHIDSIISKEIGEEIETLIFVTKHASKSGKPSFSVHTQGNWSSAEYGGKPFTVAITPVVLKHALFFGLRKYAAQTMPDFEVVQECTHHGPDVSVPSLFIEIGSTENEWVRLDAATVIANTLREVLSQQLDEKQLTGEKKQKPVFLGIGGNHTCANFMKYVQADVAMLGHVCPGYRSAEVTIESLQEGLTKSTLPSIVVVDWKGMNSAQRSHVLKLLDDAKISYTILSDLKKTLGAFLPRGAAVE